MVGTGGVCLQRVCFSFSGAFKTYTRADTEDSHPVINEWRGVGGLGHLRATYMSPKLVLLLACLKNTCQSQKQHSRLRAVIKMATVTHLLPVLIVMVRSQLLSLDNYVFLNCCAPPGGRMLILNPLRVHSNKFF
jgi:hypothetical protein